MITSSSIARDDIKALLDQRIVVTGGTGFIGTRLCHHLGNNGITVDILSRTPPTEALPESVRWHQLDLADTTQTTNTLRELRPDTIFHLCSYAQGERDRSLVLPTLQGELIPMVNVLMAADELDCRRIVTTGSLEEPEPGPPPSSPYAAAKAASRLYTGLFHGVYGTPIVNTRIFMAYGPGQSGKKIVMHCIQTLLAGKPLYIKSPTRPVDWIYIDDVVAGLIRTAVEPGLEGQSVDLGTGQLTAISDLVLRLKNITSSTSSIQFNDAASPEDEEVRRADITRTKTQIRWEPGVSLDHGLQTTVHAVRECRHPKSDS